MGGRWGCGDGGWSGHNRPSSGLGAVIRQTAIVCTDVAITGAVARHPSGINDTLSLQRPLPAVGVIRMRIHTVCCKKKTRKFRHRVSKKRKDLVPGP